ncbi:MAG: hypothetical protein EKK53_17260 [Burkholderiales bacterium]|nr:MAG: hypothetical protein EKK53_17260 [Burkholderiales bacterium]
MSDTCAVFLRPGRATLDTAAASLQACGLTVVKTSTHLVVHRPGSPSFAVRWVTGPHVPREAIEIGSGTAYEAELSWCSERFEIQISNLGEALDEINTLMEVQGALQDASGGFLFLPWNGHLSGPWPTSGAA